MFNVYTLKDNLLDSLYVVSHNPSIKPAGIKLKNQPCFLNFFSEGLNHRVWEKRLVSMFGFTKVGKKKEMTCFKAKQFESRYMRRKVLRSQATA